MTLPETNPLFDQLDAARGKRLIVLVGEGGADLLKTWIEGNHLRAAWLRLDEGDNNPARFVERLYACLPAESGLEPPTGAPSALEDALVDLLNACVELEDELYWVLEEYQKINNPQVHAGVALALDYAPPRLHIILLTAGAPSSLLPIPRLRVRGLAVEVIVDSS